MPFLAFIIAIVIVFVLLAFAMVFGLIGAVKEGPEPHEGNKSTG